jgi:hypothetical protein
LRQVDNPEINIRLRETIRAWFAAVEVHLLNIIFGKSRGKYAMLTRSALIGLFKVYKLGLVIRRFAFRARLNSQKKNPPSN